MTQLINFAAEFADLLIKHSGYRYAASSKDARGRIVQGAQVAFTFKGTYPQPAGGSDLKLASGGSTESGSLVVHSVQQLNITTGNTKGDIVTWEGEDYFVMQSNKRNHLAGNYRNLLRKIQAGE